MNNLKNNAFENDSQKFKPLVKTVYLDTENKTSPVSFIFGIIFLFLCIFAGCIGLIFCIADSFQLNYSLSNILISLTASLLFFTVIYFLPSRIFTILVFLIGAGFFSYHIVSHLDKIINAGYSFLNLCLYQINQAGYTIGPNIDYNLAKNTPLSDINEILFLASVLFALIFSYLVYSKKNVIYTIILSVAVVFPGFFYGLIPTYFSFSLVTAFWVAHFAINMFDTGYIAYLTGKQNTIPEKRLEKQKFKSFKKQYRKNVKSIKSEIVNILKSPNREENSIRLDKLVRQLEAVSKETLFLKFHRLDEHINKTSAKPAKSVREETEEKILHSAINTNKNKKPDKFINPVKLEKHRLSEQAKERKTAEKLQRKEEYKKVQEQPFSQRIKLRFSENFNSKKKNSVKSGFGGIFAFIVALCAILVVQPFISPNAKFNVSMPEKIMSFFTDTVEYFLVGSDSSVYGGYNGGMGGGYLYKPGGVKFKNKPILKVSATTKSSVIYLRGWVGGIYDGKMWLEADKNQIEKYSELEQNIFSLSNNDYTDKTFFKSFTQNMQKVFKAAADRQASELKSDSVTIEHLVSGGRRAFLPYFYDSYSSGFNLKTNADLNTGITNSLFKYPSYTVNFYSADNILDRTMPYAVDDLKEYLDNYSTRLGDLSFWTADQIQSEFPGAYIATVSELNSSIQSDPNLNGKYIFVPYFYSETGGNTDSSYINNADITSAQYNNFIVIPSEYGDKVTEIQNNSQYWNQGFDQPFYNCEFDYDDYVRQYYLDVPDTLPQEVKDLAAQITEGCQTDYNKALAIEKYLADNYTYTLNPKAPYDPQADFVYNFLFDTKEGYCTYYASAMVMMLRSLNVPARYVEGFLVDTSKKTKSPDDGKDYIIVYDYNAHAWPEVYLRGIGWIPFEPTASYGDAAPKVETPYVYNPPARLPGEGSMMPTEPVTDDSEDVAVAANSAVSSDLSKVLFIILLIIIAASVIYIVNYIINSRRFKYFKNSNANAAVIKMLSYILNFLRYCGFVMYNEESLKDFSRRIAPSFAMMNPDGWGKIMDIMQKARYSSHEISEEERTYVYDFISYLRKECMKKLKFDLRLKLRFVYFVL
ncbi:MAG: hypothetical protein FWD71_16590 [Oscillospiraceae bacterium]|nr:hypothetical protein [Oscillospiraceae bacterium]